MKLISKYKDYYDYLVGVYGIDEKLVYDRRFKTLITRGDVTSYFDEPIDVYFHICNFRYDFWFYRGKWYHTPEELKEMNQIRQGTRKRSVYGTGWQRSEKNFNDPKYRFTDANIKFRQPVLISGKFSMLDVDFRDKSGNGYGVPILKDFPIPKYLDAESIYQAITGFLGWLNDNPEIPNKQSNEEKILSHGFDLKSSFRPNIKK